MWFIPIWITNNLWFKSGSGDIHGNSVSPRFCPTRVSFSFLWGAVEGLQSAPTYSSVLETRYALSAAVEEHIDLLIHLFLFFLNPADYFEGSHWKYFQEVDRGCLFSWSWQIYFLKKHTQKNLKVCLPRKLNLKIFVVWIQNMNWIKCIFYKLLLHWDNTELMVLVVLVT